MLGFSLLRFASNPQIWIVAGTLFAAGYLIHYGNTHGSNARELAAVRLQLADTNSRLKGFSDRDEQAAIDADVARSEGYDRAVSTLKLAPKDRCPATPAMIRAFEMVRQ